MAFATFGCNRGLTPFLGEDLPHVPRGAYVASFGVRRLAPRPSKICSLPPMARELSVVTLPLLFRRPSTLAAGIHWEDAPCNMLVVR